MSNESDKVKGYVSIPIELSNEELFVLFNMAHEQNITFNQLCNNILIQRMEEESTISFSTYVQELGQAFAHSGKEKDIDYLTWLERKLYDHDVPIYDDTEDEKVKDE